MSTPHTPVPGRWDEADAGSPFSAPAPGQRNLSKRFRVCHPSPRQRRALGWHGGMCHPRSRTAMSLSPAQFHLHPQSHLPMAPALTDQSHRARAASSPQLQQQTRSHTHTAAGPWGSARGAVGQAAPPGTGEGGGRAEASRKWGWQRWGRLGGGTCFCGQNTLVLLQHHPRPSPPSGLQLGLSGLLPSVPGGLAAPPRGLLSQIQVGGVGEGRG